MPARSRSENGVAERVIGPATSGRTRWLAHGAGLYVLRVTELEVDGRNKSGHDDVTLRLLTRCRCGRGFLLRRAVELAAGIGGERMNAGL